MTGIAKNAPKVLTPAEEARQMARHKEEATPKPAISNISEIDGIPLEIYRMFELGDTGFVPEKDKSELRLIYEWAIEQVDDNTDLVKAINRGMRKFGRPSRGEKPWNRLWAEIKIKQQIKRLEEEKEELYMQD
jgi:hypothetical protein